MTLVREFERRWGPPQRTCGAVSEINGLRVKCAAPADHLPAHQHEAVVRWSEGRIGGKVWTTVEVEQ